MKLLDRLLGRKAAALTYEQVADLVDGNGGGYVAGVAVTEKTALQVSTVLACVKIIADGCATPNLHVFRELDDGKRQKAANIPEYRLLARRPNEWQTSFEWRRQMTLHAALTGSGLSIKVKGDNGRVRELIPVQPGRWEVRKVSRYELRYRCWDEFGIIGDFAADDVFVLNGVQWDWANSMNAVVLARSAIGLAISAERSQSAMHENGLKPSGTYSVDGNLNAEQHERLASYLKKKSGPDNVGVPLVLDRAAKWLNTSITGVDAQHVETRRLQIEEICRGYGVFPIMVGHSDKAATFASSEAFFAAHLKHTLAPWHKAWTQRIDEMLLDGSGPLYAEFDTRYLTSGSMVDRAQWTRTMIEMGIYNANEIRDYDGLDPREGGEEYLTPMNMQTGQQAAADTAKQAADATQKAYSDLERKLTSIELKQTQTPISIDLKTADIERSVKSALETMADSYAEKVKSIANDMPININVKSADQPAPIVNIHPAITVNSPDVTFEATIPAAQVVINGPKSSVQKVERDSNDEIVQTVTTHNYV